MMHRLCLIVLIGSLFCSLSAQENKDSFKFNHSFSSITDLAFYQNVEYRQRLISDINARKKDFVISLKIGLDYRSNSLPYRDWYFVDNGNQKVSYVNGQSLDKSINLFPIYFFNIEKRFGERFGIYLRRNNVSPFNGRAYSVINSNQAIAHPELGYWLRMHKNLRYSFSLSNTSDAEFKGFASSKWIANHSLTFKKEKLAFSLFETVVWKQRSEVGTRFVDPMYLIPFNVWRPIEFASGSSDNVILGYKVRYKLIEKESLKLGLSHELLLDEFLYAEVKAGNGWWANKHGLSFAADLDYNPSKWNNFNLTLAYAHARPYTYSHSDPTQSYSSGLFSMANVLGSNYREFYASARWLMLLDKSNKSKSYRCIDTYFQARYVLQGKDLNGLNYGNDVVTTNNSRVNNYGNFIGQPNKSSYLEWQLSTYWQNWEKHQVGAWVYGKANEVIFGLQYKFGLPNATLSPNTVGAGF